MEKSTQAKLKKSLTNFLAAFFVVFGFSFSAISLFTDILPGESDAPSNVLSGEARHIEENKKYEAPQRIVISKINIDQKIYNPQSADSKVLDAELLKGVVRYPDSGLLGENKNMFLFGHSTGFRTVNNQSYKAFNRLGELLPNDEIVVMSGTEAHVYRVVNVNLEDAGDTVVQFSPKRTLTLSTCNVWGRKEERFVVHAEFVRDYKLSE